MILVVDASVAAKWFLEEDRRAAALDLLRRDDPLHAPDWIVSEVGRVLFRKWDAREIGAQQARLALDALPLYFDRLHRTSRLMPRAFDLALELPHTVHDCLYLACAEALEATVVTADTGFARAARRTPYAGHVRHLDDPFPA